MSELVVNINGSAAGASDPNALFFMILSTLEFGLDNDDENACRESLVALGALAAAELRKQKNGGGGGGGGAATDSPLLMQTTQTVASFIVEGGSATADNNKPNALMVQLSLSPLGKCLRIVWKRLPVRGRVWR